MSGNT